jgi:hypothetical protein
MVSFSYSEVFSGSCFADTSEAIRGKNGRIRIPDDQIMYALAQESTCEAIVYICRAPVVALQTAHRRKNFFEAVELSEVPRRKQLEEASLHLKDW